MEGRTQAMWFWFLCSRPHSRPVGNTGLGDGGQEYGLNRGWHHVLACAVLRGACRRESSWQKKGEEEASERREKGDDYRRLQSTWFFSKCCIKILIEFHHFPCGYWPTPCPPRLSLHGSSCAMLLGLLTDCSDFYFLSWKNLIPCQVFVPRIHLLDISPFPQVALITEIDLVLGGTYTVEWDVKIRDEEKIDCYPDESGVSAENCTSRGCVWEVTMLTVLIYMRILYTLL